MILYCFIVSVNLLFKQYSLDECIIIILNQIENCEESKAQIFVPKLNLLNSNQKEKSVTNKQGCISDTVGSGCFSSVRFGSRVGRNRINSIRIRHPSLIYPDDKYYIKEKLKGDFFGSKLGRIRIQVLFRGSNPDPVFLHGRIRILVNFNRILFPANKENLSI